MEWRERCLCRRNELLQGFDRDAGHHADYSLGARKLQIAEH
jgi:hypothetical protein